MLTLTRHRRSAEPRDWLIRPARRRLRRILHRHRGTGAPGPQTALPDQTLRKTSIRSPASEVSRPPRPQHRHAVLLAVSRSMKHKRRAGSPDGDGVGEEGEQLRVYPLRSDSRRRPDRPQRPSSGLRRRRGSRSEGTARGACPPFRSNNSTTTTRTRGITRPNASLRAPSRRSTCRKTSTRTRHLPQRAAYRLRIGASRRGARSCTAGTRCTRTGMPVRAGLERSTAGRTVHSENPLALRSWRRARM